MRKVIGLLLVAMMIFSLAACGENEETTESAETTKSVTVTPEHSESVEASESTEPTESAGEPSEKPTENTEEPSEEPTEQAETAEPTEATVSPQEETVEPVSAETVLEMANILSFWMANSNFGTDRVDLDFDMCCEVSAITAAYGVQDGESSYGGTAEDGAYYINIVPEENINQQLHNLFGSNYQAANYTRQEFDSAFTKVVPDFASVPTKCMIRTDDGQFALYNYSEWMDTFEGGVPEVLNVSLENDDSETCIGTVRYSLSYMGNYDGYIDITFWLKPDEGSEFQWVITAIQSGGFVAG